MTKLTYPRPRHRQCSTLLHPSSRTAGQTRHKAETPGYLLFFPFLFFPFLFFSFLFFSFLLLFSFFSPFFFEVPSLLADRSALRPCQGRASTHQLYQAINTAPQFERGNGASACLVGRNPSPDLGSIASCCRWRAGSRACFPEAVITAEI